VLLAAVLLAGCNPPPPPQLSKATQLPSPKPVTDFRLIDHNSKPFTRERLQGTWTFVFFGYTHCPDVCPTSLTMLGQVQKTLEQSAPDELPQVLFISVDPERDSVEQLARFTPYFHPTFLGVTGEPDEIQRLSRQLGILYMRTEGESTDDYLVDHSAAIMLFDPDGRFHAVFSAPHEPESMASDYLAMKNWYEVK